jgi:hypothetical protein
MKLNRIFTSSAIALGALATLGATGCGPNDKACDDLIARLCVDHPDRCADARPWVDAQAGVVASAEGAPQADRDAGFAACAAALSSEAGYAAYAKRFEDSRVRPAAAPVAAPAAAVTPATTREKIKSAGEIIEEIGKAAETTGGAIDRVEVVIDR